MSIDVREYLKPHVHMSLRGTPRASEASLRRPESHHRGPGRRFAPIGQKAVLFMCPAQVFKLNPG